MCFSVRSFGCALFYLKGKFNMKRKKRIYNALIVGAMLLTLTACDTNKSMECTSSIAFDKSSSSNSITSTLPQSSSSPQSNFKNTSEEKSQSSTIPIQTSSTSSSKTTNTSNQISSADTSPTETSSISTSSFSTSSTPTKNVSSKEQTVTSTSSQTDPTKVNDSSNIVFEDESAKIAIKGVGWVPIREAYEKGYIRIKIINGIAYHVSSMNGVDYIRPANIDTGISYDGESPIVFTYADGTTGIEKRDGATYEYLPGIVYTYEAPKDGAGRLIGSTCPICNKTVGANSCEHFSRSQYCHQCGEFVEHNTCHSCASNSSSTHHCSDCGKISGDGTKGTCVQWLMSDVDCPNCGKHVAVRTCHTCVTNGQESLFCSECGKQMGDGTKGTCLSYWTGGDHDCPNCGVTIPQKTCHSCGN